MVALFLFAGCGGSSGTGDEAAPDLGVPGAMEVEDLIRTEAFSGTLVVHFDDALAVRTDKAMALVSLAGQDAKLAPALEVLSAHPQVAIARYVNQPEELVEAQRVRLERLSGREMPDWNSVYRLKVADPEEAVAVMTELRGKPGVTYVYPEFRPYPASLESTPSLVGWQAYLNPEATHGGLDAQAAWAAGVHGAGVIVVDHEEGLNFGHEDLGLTAIDYLDDPTGSYIAQPDCAPGFPEAVADCPAWIAHGTAVAGILVAQDNGHGVTGFAPQAKYLSASMLDGVTAELAGSTDGIDEPTTELDNDIEPGTIWIIEVQLPGKYSAGSCTSTATVDGQYGCVPVELWPDSFDAIAQATAYGVTVIEGGGNGSMNLNDPTLYTGSWSFAKNMATEDAGAIMVGASQGSNEQKATFSNCGTRMNAFAWGQSVATTGYPYGLYAWEGTTAPVPPNTETNTTFINNFGGTSSAAAMVGGAAVLVQSHARAELGHKRYLMPFKMREILTGTGVAQADAGCNIGMQPRIDEALAQVDAFLTTAIASYPELESDAQLTQARMIALRALGVGIICRKQDPENSDPACPEEELWPEGERLGKRYDFDGDGRADLVKFENGLWSVDLSSVGGSDDGFGAWDLTLVFPAIAGKWVWPYVEDMNSDGRADFVAYDREHGHFYVALMATEVQRTGDWPGWDWILDYSAEWHDDLKLDPAESNYSRPVIGNFNRLGYALDGWNDIAIICSDGQVRIDYGAGTEASFAGYESELPLISDTLLAMAPGWAYLPVIGDFNGDNSVNIGFKVPDGLADEGRVYLSGFDGEFHVQENDWFAAAPYIYGGNDVITFGGVFQPASYTVVALKGADSRWRLSNDLFDALSEPAPAYVYGDEQCHPTVADYDGDGLDDRVVMCPEEWRIVYSGDAFAAEEDADGVRRIGLGYDKSAFSLPGRAYYGGVSYTYTQQLIELFQAMHPGTPPPILVDMVTVSSH